MKHLVSEKHPGQNGEDFNIRIVDQHTHIETSINLMIKDDQEEREILIKRIEDPIGSTKEALLEKAKKTIVLITILRTIDPTKSAPIFEETPKKPS